MKFFFQFVIKFNLELIRYTELNIVNIYSKLIQNIMFLTI